MQEPGCEPSPWRLLHGGKPKKTKRNYEIIFIFFFHRNGHSKSQQTYTVTHACTNRPAHSLRMSITKRCWLETYLEAESGSSQHTRRAGAQTLLRVVFSRWPCPCGLRQSRVCGVSVRWPAPTGKPVPQPCLGRPAERGGLLYPRRSPALDRRQPCGRHRKRTQVVGFHISGAQTGKRVGREACRFCKALFGA